MNKAKLLVPTEHSPTVLDQLISRCCHELRMMSQVRAALIDSDGAGKGSNKQEDKPPPGVRNRLWDEDGQAVEGRVEDADLPRIFTLEYLAATNNWDRLQVIARAQKALRRQRYSVDEMAKYKGTMEWKMAVAMDDRDSATVARVYRCSASYVRTLRKRLRDLKLVSQ